MSEDGRPLLSTWQLIFVVLLALMLGVGLTVFVILPAEGGKDRGGLAAASGLDKLSAQQAPVTTVAKPGDVRETDAVKATKALYIAIDPQTTPAQVDEFGEAQPLAVGENIRRHDAEYRTDSVEFQIDSDAALEYKAIMQQGEVLLYAWQADGEMYYDFHAHQTTGDPDFFTRYAAGETTGDQGSIVAAYAGQHGWYWLNISGKPVTVKLKVAGYYDELLEIDLAAGQ